MILHVLRALFVLLMAAIGWSFLSNTTLFRDYTWLTMAVCLTLAVIIISVDILSPRTKLQVFSGTFLGLFVGMLVAYALSFVSNLLLDRIFESGTMSLNQTDHGHITLFVNLLIGVICCYLSISFVLQTKDDIRFVIPYIEFSRQTKGSRPMLMDTSMLIDGRITDIAATGILQSQLIVPRFVLQELQAVADSADKLKRNRGRRGLDVLRELQNNKRVDVIIYDSSMHDDAGVKDVDQRLLNVALAIGARVLTTDFNLNKVAQLRGVDVININDLGAALKPVVLPGERLKVRVVRAGEEPGQGVGFLEDGTMVVIEQGREHLGDEVDFIVTKLLQTSAGRMIFGKMDAESAAASDARRTRLRSDLPQTQA